MVSFSCEVCNDTLAKKKLDQHRNQCRGATFTCLDCMTHFYGTEYRSHTSCISEAQKYQGHLYRDKKGKGDKRKSIGDPNGISSEMVPRKAYVEDVPEGDDSQAVAMVDVPPRAPTPPPTDLSQNVNVFDFLVGEASPQAKKSYKKIEHSVHFANGDSQQSYTAGISYSQDGFEYGRSPVHPSLDRYDSLHAIPEVKPSHAMMPPSEYVTPAAKAHRKEKREIVPSDKKRKRYQVDDLDLTTTKRPVSRDGMMIDSVSHTSSGRVLHSGLTGGLSKLITDPEFYNDRIDSGPTPISPIKRSKRGDDSTAARDERRKSSYTSQSTATSKIPSGKSRSPDRTSTSHDDRHRRHRNRRQDSISSNESYSPRPSRKTKTIEYTTGPPRPSSVQPSATNQLVGYHPRADLFLSFIKGPDSQHGCSVNKLLKRYHRERDTHGDDRDEDDKELFKSLRLKRNDRGEIVLFVE